MGASASTARPSTYSGEGKVGKFLVPAALQRDTLVLSRLFERLLSTNNLLNFAKLMQEKDKCGELQIVLASQINKEFQTLRFPDPSVPSALQTVSFIDDAMYEKLRESGIVRKMCTRISEFLIRFVALVASLSLSIAMPRGLPEISESSGQDIYRPSKAPMSTPLQKKIWDVLQTISSLNVEMIGGSADMPSELMLLDREFFLNKTGYAYLNKPKSAILNVEFEYFRYDDPSNPFQKISEVDAKEARQQSERRQYETKLESYMAQGQSREEAEAQIKRERERVANPYGYMQQVQQGQQGQQGPQVQPMQPMQQPFAQPIQQGGRRKTRITKRASRTRRTRRYKGGQGPFNTIGQITQSPQMQTVQQTSQPNQMQTMQTLKQFYRITFKTQAGTEVLRLVFTDNGDAYDMRSFDAAKGSRTELQSLQPSIVDGRRLNILMAFSQAFKAAGKEEQEMIRERFTGAQAITLDQLQKFSILSEKEFYSPAAYRAFLLASMIPIQNVNALESYFCKDSWALTTLNSKPAYAAFEGLFGIKSNDVTEGDERAPADKSQFIQRMTANRFTEQKREGGDFGSIQFPDNKDARTRAKIAGICAAARTPALLVDNKESVAILMAGYNELKQLYLNHIQTVYEFLKTILVVDSEFEQLIQLSEEAASNKPVIRLNDQFVKYALGSHMALNERIQTARSMLGEHYFQVERIYNETLNKLNALV